MHGPVVATSDDGTLARSVQLAMYRRELETVSGILGWNRADTLEEFTAATAQVTWNENVLYADADGHIAYWHPGLFPRRHPSVDEHFPSRGRRLPGLGRAPRLRGDAAQRRPGAGLPHQLGTTSPPSAGPTSTSSPPPPAPSGPVHRALVIERLLADASDVDLDGLVEVDRALGSTDQRSLAYLPLLTGLSRDGLTAQQAGALALLDGYDGSHYGIGAGTSDLSAEAVDDESVTDGPAATLFGAVADRLPQVALGAALPGASVTRADGVGGNHVYDLSPADVVVLRALEPASSDLALRTDVLAGRTPSEVLLAALDAAVADLTSTYGADPATWRRQHARQDVSSLTGVIGPSTTVPFQDRGTWIHLVDFGQRPGDAPAGPEPVVPEAPWPGAPGPGRRGAPRPGRRPPQAPAGSLTATNTPSGAGATRRVRRPQ